MPGEEHQAARIIQCGIETAADALSDPVDAGRSQIGNTVQQDAVIWVASPAAASINGQAIVVAGGEVMAG